MTSPFIPIYRQFPVEDGPNLEKQLVNAYQQTATAVNQRDIGTYDTNIVPNGQRWFAANNAKLRDAFRIVVQVSDAVLTVAHGIPLINQLTRLYGTFFDGTSWQTLPFISVTGVTNQISIRVTSTQVIVTKGAGAPPTIASGIVVVEYI